MDEKFEGMLDCEIEKMKNELLDEVGKQIKAEDDLSSIINPEKIKQMTYVYGVLKQMLKGSRGKIKCTLNEPFKSMGCISIIGKDLSFNKSKSFLAASDFASNVDIYPKTDGSVQIDFTFHGLTVPVEQGD